MKLQTTHILKIDPAQFDEIRLGYKRHEVRRTDDRAFKFGDILCLQSFDRVEQRFHRDDELLATVTDITRGGTYGLPEDLCVMTIRLSGDTFQKIGEVKDEPQYPKPTHDSKPATSSNPDDQKCEPA